MTKQLRLDIRKVDADPTGYMWFLQTTGPIRDLWASPCTFATKSLALRHFQEVTELAEYDNLTINSTGD